MASNTELNVKNWNNDTKLINFKANKLNLFVKVTKDISESRCAWCVHKAFRNFLLLTLGKIDRLCSSCTDIVC